MLVKFLPKFRLGVNPPGAQAVSARHSADRGAEKKLIHLDEFFHFPTTGAK